MFVFALYENDMRLQFSGKMECVHMTFRIDYWGYFVNLVIVRSLYISLLDYVILQSLQQPQQPLLVLIIHETLGCVCSTSRNCDKLVFLQKE